MSQWGSKTDHTGRERQMIFILGELSMQVNDVAITMLFMKLKFALTFLLHNFSADQTRQSWEQQCYFWQH